jgi:chromosome segregation ATPase
VFLIAAQLTVLEVAIFILASIAFIIAIRFFIESRKGLEQFLPAVVEAEKEKKKQLTFFGNLVFIKRKFRMKRKPLKLYATVPPVVESETSRELSDLRSMIHEQQSQLSQALAQMNVKPPKAEAVPDKETQKKVKDLQLALDKKEAEIKKYKQQLEVSTKMQTHFESMQKEFGQLQQKMQKLEVQAREANDLKIKLDHVQQSLAKVEKDLIRKEDKLRDITAESQKLHTALNETEDKLQESNLQRQQMMKKVQFLEEMNDDMKEIADNNRKLQNELRRVAELESMLNIMTEERDELLKKKFK